MDQCITPEGYKLCPELQQVGEKTRENLKETASKIDKPLERIYKIRPSWRPKRDRAFNEDIVDSEFEAEREREFFENNL